MNQPTQFRDDGFERMPLRQFTEKSYLDYSMYVILDRALPHTGDGMKPVQRRIIYAMSELGLGSNSKHKKSARTVGDVIGKYHPHGDSACYEAMVLMAQSFSYRYPLVDGQGNWGSEDDPKSFAAMRYTEARLTPFAQVLLEEVNQGTVDWMPNFDGTLDEPAVLPAKLPVVLLNGAMGIAVGMATDIPPHNLREVAAACIELLDNPDATIRDLTKHIKGPDYPTDAEIISTKQELFEIYKTGNGSVRMRAKYEIEDNDIVITALPYQTSGAKILEQIAAQMHAKKLPMVEDLRDESDHENPTRFVITPRGEKFDNDALMNHLFATTDLERSYRVNLNMISTDGRPVVRDLRGILSDWIAFRTNIVTRRLQTRLEKILKRLHILGGLHIAFLNIDEVIRIIRNEDQPKPALIKRFKLSEEQAEAILELKLRHLAKLEEMKILTEQKELSEERDGIEKTLGSKKRMVGLIKKEIEEVTKEFGDARRSRIVQREAAQAIDVTELVPAEPITVVLSEKGLVRAAKGHEVDPLSLTYKPGDQYVDHELTQSNKQVVFMDSTGRTYCLAAHELPSARGYGDPLSGKLKPPPGANFKGVLVGDDSDSYFVGSDAGYGFTARMADMITRNRAGKALVSVEKGASAVTPMRIADFNSQWVALATDDGHLLLFPTAELPEMSKGKGIKLISLPVAKDKSSPKVKAALILFDDSELVLHAGGRSKVLAGKELDEYIGERGKRGLKLPRGFQSFERIEVTHKQ